LSDALVIFYPDTSQENHSPIEPRNRTDRQGIYQLRAEGELKIAPGWYRVAVIPQKQGMKENATTNPNDQMQIDRCYLNPESSGLSILVSPKVTHGAYDLPLTRKRGAN
jgi:hypothetical protein